MKALRRMLAPLVPLLIFWAKTAACAADVPVRLQESFPSGYQYHVSSRVELTGMLTLPAAKGKPEPKPLQVGGSSAIDYDERVLSTADGQVQKTARIYRRIDFERQVGDDKQQNTLRPAVRRLFIMRLKQMEVPFSPDGPLTWSEIDMVRTDVFTPALAGLLADQPVRVGDRWTAANPAILELTDMERIDDGKVECKLDEIATLGKQRLARVGFVGTVRGVNEDGPNRQQLEGYYYFDLDARHLSYLYLKGGSFMLDKDGKTLGKVEGRFVLTRQASRSSNDLGDDVLKAIGQEPNDDNTALLYDNPDLGVRFLYPRRWRVAGVRGRQLGVDETNGSGLLFTFDSLNQVTTGAQFQRETAAWLQQQKAKTFRTGTLQRIAGAPGDLEHFDFDVELMGQRVVMDYYVFRQALGGATLAARLLPNDMANLHKDIERIARSLTITKTIRAELKK